MILVDTSIWVDHLRRSDGALTRLLGDNAVLVHPFIVGEIACGSLGNRQQVIGLLQDLPMAQMADESEFLAYVATHELFGQGVGFVDVHLLAAVSLTPGASIWTRDKRLRAAAETLGIGWTSVSN